MAWQLSLCQMQYFLTTNFTPCDQRDKRLSERDCLKPSIKMYSVMNTDLAFLCTHLINARGLSKRGIFCIKSVGFSVYLQPMGLFG